MALIKCNECNSEISSKAAACPKCGAPVTAASRKGDPKRGRLYLFIIAAVLLWLVLSWVQGLMSPDDEPSSSPAASPPAAAPSQHTPTVDKSPEMQAKRAQLLGKLQASGLLGKVDCRAQVGDMWVTGAFMALSFDDKQKFASVVYAYCFDGGDSLALVNLKDDRTGKDVGVYATTYGGLKMK